MLNEKKVVPKLRQDVKVKVDIVTSDNMKIYYTGKFQDFTARYMIKYELFFVNRGFNRFAKSFGQCRQTQSRHGPKLFAISNFSGCQKDI